MKKIKDTNEQYHSSDAISASGLKYIYQNSVQKFLQRQAFSSKAMNLGSAVHAAMLEPAEYINDFHVMPKIDGRTKAGKEEKAKHEELSKGKILLTADENEIVSSISANYNSHELARKFCTGEIELSHYKQHEGVDVRIRPDVVNYKEGFISDVKTCQDNSPKAFRRDVYKYGYPIQAVFYSEMLGIDPSEFRFIAVQTKHPFSVEVYAMSEQMIEYGREGWKQAFHDWKFYKETGIALGHQTAEVKDDGTLIL